MLNLMKGATESHAKSLPFGGVVHGRDFGSSSQVFLYWSVLEWRRSVGICSSAVVRRGTDEELQILSVGFWGDHG